MTRAELGKLIEIRDGFKNAYWDFEKWRWAMKWDQYLRDAAFALEQAEAGAAEQAQPSIERGEARPNPANGTVVPREAR